MKRTSVLFLLFSALALLTAGAAQATHWDSFEATADCDGFAVNGTVRVGSVDSPYIEIPYDITLTQDGLVVEEFTGTVQAYFQIDPDVIEVSATFATDLQGDYTVAGVFTLPRADQGDPEAIFSIDVACGDPVDPPQECEVHTAAWYLCHLEDWPVDSLEIGGCDYSQGQLVWLATRCRMSFAAKKLLRELVAAKLNVAGGCDHAPMDAIAAADAFFAEHGMRGCLRRSERRLARDLANDLREFNGSGESDCGCGGHDGHHGGHDGHHGGHGGGHGGHGGGCGKSAEKIQPEAFDIQDEVLNMSDLKEIYR